MKKQVRGSGLVEKLLLVAFTLGAGVGTTTLLVERIKEANGDINVEIGETPRQTYSEEDVAFFEEYGFWPGTYKREYSEDGAAGVNGDYWGIQEYTINNDGTVEYYHYSNHPYWGTEYTRVGRLEPDAGEDVYKIVTNDGTEYRFSVSKSYFAQHHQCAVSEEGCY